MDNPLHKAQHVVLEALRHTPEATFSALMQPTGLQSDAFKFHIRRLAQSKLISKNPQGTYSLTRQGKEFANKLSPATRTSMKQPKLSMLILVTRTNAAGQREYLMQQRLRQPFYGFWSCIGGPTPWGDSCEEAAARELSKQTGLTAQCEVVTFYRKRDYDKATQVVLEDKIFVVLRARSVTGGLTNTWHGGHNAWMTIDEFKQKESYFESVCEIVDAVSSNKSYLSQTAHYEPTEY